MQNKFLCHKVTQKKAVNDVINKIAKDFEKIIAMTKSKYANDMPKTFHQITKNEEHTIKNKTDKK